MNRRQLISAAIAAAAPLPAHAASRTQWQVRGSEGFDALCFLGPLSGKPFYARYYAAELAEFQPRFPAAAQAALAELQKAADARGALLAPMLCNLFSGGDDGSLDDLIASLDGAESRLMPPFQASPYWDPVTWGFLLSARPGLRTVLTSLRDAGFPDFRRRFTASRLSARVEALSTRLAGLDVIAEQERLLGRALQPDIAVILLWFSKPHGTRIQGQRFLSHLDYPDDITIRIAGHEILHPPFPMDGPAARAALEVLGRDELFTRIVAEHDRAFGYNSLEGLLNEDTVQALDQIVAERLGVALSPAKRWTEADDGMHVLAAGLYGTLKADGYDRRGGRIERWMAHAVRSGKLSPGRLHAAAASVLQVPTAGLWPRKRA